MTTRASSWITSPGTSARDAARLVGIDARRERTAPARELAHRRRDLLGRLARAVDQLGHAGAQLAMVIDHDRLGGLGIRQLADLVRERRAGAIAPLRYGVEQGEQLRAIHDDLRLPCTSCAA